MTMKLLITTCLLVASLSASAQSATNKHLYNESFHSFEQGLDYSQGFNVRFTGDHQKPLLLAAEQRFISKSEAIEIARQRTDGKILSADLIQKGQQAFYKIKVLTDQGRIKTVRINAQRR